MKKWRDRNIIESYRPEAKSYPPTKREKASAIGRRAIEMRKVIESL